MRYLIHSGSDDALNDTTTEYQHLTQANNLAWTATENDRRQVFSCAGYFWGLRVKLTGSPGLLNHYDFTLRVNGAGSALTLRIRDTATQASDLVNEVTIAAGDYVTLESNPNSTPTVRVASWCVWFESAEDQINPFVFGSPDALNAVVNETNWPLGGSTWIAALPAGNLGKKAIMLRTGTFKQFYGLLSAAPGAGTQYQFNIRKNAATQFSVVISGTNTTGNDTGSSFTVAVGDLVDVQSAPTGAPATPAAYYGLSFKADDDSEDTYHAGSDDTLNTGATEYNYLSGTGSTWNATETNRRSLFPLGRIRNLHVEIGVNAGGTSNLEFTVMKNGSATALQVNIASGSTSGTDTTNVIETDDFDEGSLRLVPSGTFDIPFGRVLVASWSYVFEPYIPEQNSLMLRGHGI